MSRAIVITSGKGGVGKTTFTANLGASLAALGGRVVVMDVDIGLNNLDVAMGVENKVVYDLIDVIEGRCRLKQALIQDRFVPSLFIMPSAHSYDKSAVTGQNIKLVVERLKETFDYILLDCPAGIELGFHRAVSAADEAIVVTTPHISSIRDADKVISLLKSYELKNIQVAVNRARGDLILNGDMLSADDVFALLKINPIGVIPEDDKVAYNTSTGRSVLVGEAAKSFRFIAENIQYKRDLIYDCTSKYKGFLGSIKRNIKKKV